jgi:hypothetical protein
VARYRICARWKAFPFATSVTGRTSFESTSASSASRSRVRKISRYVGWTIARHARRPGTGALPGVSGRVPGDFRAREPRLHGILDDGALRLRRDRGHPKAGRRKHRQRRYSGSPSRRQRSSAPAGSGSIRAVTRTASSGVGTSGSCRAHAIVGGGSAASDRIARTPASRPQRGMRPKLRPPKVESSRVHELERCHRSHPPRPARRRRPRIGCAGSAALQDREGGSPRRRSRGGPSTGPQIFAPGRLARCGRGRGRSRHAPRPSGPIPRGSGTERRR